MSKLKVLHRKMFKCLKQKWVFPGFLPKENANLKSGVALFSRQHWQSLGKLNQSAWKSLLGRISDLQGKTLLSVLRYLNFSIRTKFLQHSKVPQTSKIWKNLPPQVWKDDRKSIWLTSSAMCAAYPRHARGLKGKIICQNICTTDGREGKKDGTSDRRKRECAEIMGDFQPEKISPVKPVKRKRKKTSGEETPGESEHHPPPPQRCKLSCPLPPYNFLPPEKLGYPPTCPPPCARFARPPQKTTAGKTTTTPKQKMTDRTKPDVPSIFPDLPDFPGLLAHNTCRSRKNYLNLKSAKSQMYAPQMPLPLPEDSTPKMRALVFEPLTLVLDCDVVEAPTKIFKDEVLVQVSYSGVCRSDLFLTEGKLPCGGDSPIILGHEISGKVYAAGQNVHHVSVGDDVAVDPYTACSICKYCSRGLFSACENEGLNNGLGISKNGGWAEFVVVKKSQVHKIPPGLALDQAVLLLPLSCVLSAMSKLKLSHGMKIFIQGLGLSGCLWASILHSRGFNDVMVSDRSEKRRQRYERLNLKYTFVPAEDVRKFEADVVIECTGSPISIEKSFNVLNANGQMCFFRKPYPITEVRCVPYDIIRKEITIFGNAGNSFRFAEAIDVAASLSQRYLELDKLGVQIFHLDDFREAFELKRSGEVSKIIFQFEN